MSKGSGRRPTDPAHALRCDVDGHAMPDAWHAPFWTEEQCQWAATKIIASRGGARFWSFVAKRGPDECWPWIGTKSRNGYGSFSLMSEGVRRRHTAHRFAWMLTHGPAPDHLVICHTCDNRECVNPAHLFIGTQKDNMLDMVEKGRHGSKKQEHCHKGHALTPENRDARGRCRECGRERYRNWYHFKGGAEVRSRGRRYGAQEAA